MSTPQHPFRWRSIALPALLPTLLFSIGEGAILPIIPIAADDLGATLAIAGVIAALITLGEMFGSIPSGWVIARVGERPAMIGAAALSLVGLLAAVLAPNLVVLGAGILLVGLAGGVFALARHAFMTSFVPITYRARALSTLGGLFRLGYFIGPFVTAAMIHLTGTASSAFWIATVTSVATAVILITLPDPTTSFGQVSTVREAGRRMREGEALVERESVGLFRTIWSRRDVLTRLGAGSAIVSALRASRQVILPLWAVSIGIGDANTALIIGAAGAIDFALFYLGGFILDRFGRLWGALPSLAGLAAGHLVLAFTHNLDSRVAWYIGAAMLLAVANGLGSGLLMTIGADLADPANPAPFLGAWRFTNTTGAAIAPFLLAGITAAASIAVAAGTLGVLGLVGIGILARFIPRYTQPGRRASG